LFYSSFSYGGAKMLKEKIVHQWGVMEFIILIAVLIFCATSINAQNWSALPPYNLLWPLWSPALSPVNPITGLATPLINELTANTVLPAQPGLIWDPAAFPKGPPWLLYNVPTSFGSGLVYWDLLYGLNPFPPSYLLTTSGLPIPITLKPNYSALLPTKTKGFASWVDVANILYASTFDTSTLGLLTALQIWGLPVI